MATLKEYRDSRLENLEALKNLGIEPYPADSQRSHMCAQLSDEYKKLEGKSVAVAGRLIAVREHGQVWFFDLKDASGSVQLVAKADELKSANSKLGELNFEQLRLLDSGDFVEAHGKLGKSKKGEISVFITKLRILTKAIRPLPDQWSGLKDKETRLRRRYLDTNLNPEVYQRFIRRSRFWQATRQFLLDEGFIEINVPVLEHTTGGADANPFVTHMDALDEDFYLRISHELPLKRLIGGGYEKVFDIGPRFRNENYSDEHLPEHVAMEFYWAYADWRDGMVMVERLIKSVAKQAFGKQQFKVGDSTIDLSKKWDELDFGELLKKHYDIDAYNAELPEVQAQLKKHKIETSKQDNLARGLDKLWKNLRKDIPGPAFVTGIPKLLSPLAKVSPDDPQKAERFWPIIVGTEMGTGWSELNDPREQLERFLEQQQLREAGDPEAQMLDIDYVEMLEYAMPPTLGYGFSERLFWSLEGVSAREGVPFPQLRREVDSVTKALYPQVFKPGSK
jgi:lysyl-tRNA synthetase, class II